MMEGKATAEEQAAKSALGGRIQSIRRKFRRGRADESGLTTLEWLLIVAAVAGLAALAVVLVQNVVSETGEQIAGRSARLTAAQLAAEDVTTNARGKLSPTPSSNIQTFIDPINSTANRACRTLKITYGDAIEGATWTDADLTAARPTADTDTAALCEVTAIP